MSSPLIQLIEPFSGKIFPGSGVVVIKEQEILMVLIQRRNLLRWELPSGKQSAGEELEETAIRETKEETFLTVAPIKPIATCWHYSNILNGGFLGVFYLSNLVSSENDIKPKYRLNNIKFDRIHREELNNNLAFSKNLSETYEKIIAVGFVDFNKLNINRAHPLHYKIIDSYLKNKDNFIFISGNADLDIELYSKNQPIISSDNTKQISPLK